MRTFLSSCIIALGGFALPATATAGGITYDCDTAANHFSQLDLPTVGVPFTVSGNVQLNALAGSSTYVPIARVWIASSAPPGRSPDAHAGFSLSALSAGAKKTSSGSPAIQMLSFNVTEKDDEVLPLSMMTKPGTVQPFRLSYDGSNVSVNLGNESKSFPMRTADPVVSIICSTGEFLFTNVAIQSAR